MYHVQKMYRSKMCQGGSPNRYNGHVYILDHTRVEKIQQEPTITATVCEPFNRELTFLPTVKRGEVGEICLGGVQLGLGYMNRPEATAEKFIHHPQFGRYGRSPDGG